MEKCQYTEVPDNSESVLNRNKNIEWRPFLKQLLICSGAWTSMFINGLCIGAPTVIIPQIRREANNTNIITEDMASWLIYWRAFFGTSRAIPKNAPSTFSFSAFPFVLLLCIFTRFVGRKIPFIIAILDTFAALLILYFSSSITHLMISGIMQGLLTASQMVVTVMIVTEYTSPKYRGIFLTIKTATFYWGIWVSNAIGTFFHWKIIPLFGIACSLYTLVTLMLWPESPYWLSSRGKFKECAASHRSIKGCDEDAEKELEALINSQKEYIASCGSTKLSARDRVVDFYKTIKSREFYKPTLISIMTGSLSIFTGKFIFVLYAIDILKKITNSESTAYVAMLILDGVTILSMYVGCALSKYVKRRTLLLVTSTVGVIFLFILSLYLYLISLSIIMENKYFSISLLVAFSIAVSCGPVMMCASVRGELIPIRSRNLSQFTIILTLKLMYIIFLKNALLMFRSFGLHGAFLLFGISSLITIIILYKYLPETKDKTLQEIADNMMGVKLNKREATSTLLVENKV